MSVSRRIVSGSLANSAGIGMNALLQLLSVPVLASVWGVERYGLWMMLTTIPTYFALTDLGFVQAATSSMTMEIAAGQRQKALGTFQSASLLIFLICMAAVGLVGIAAAVIEYGSFGVPFQHMDVVLLLALFAALSLVSRMPLAALRASGHYAIGTISYDFLVLVEGLAALSTAFLGGGFAEVALCQLVMRSLNMVVLYALLRRQVSWLRYGFGHASIGDLRRLFKPAIAAMAIPVSLAINLQGTVLIIGAVLSPAAVALYTPVRTCSRLLVQIIGVVNRATMPELSKAFALADNRQLSGIIRINSLMIGCVLLPGALLFAFFGKEFVELWSGGHISPSRSFVVLMALATSVHGAWYFVSNMLLATNSHVSFARFSLGASLFTLLLTFVLCTVIGLDGAAIALIAGEALCAVAAVRLFISRHRSAS
ncbi:lipopolysaccharide biosynthesis protein [Neorhizobium alkalisoli]|uniref:lipopolysaccharide biosynthesis protein n=1 Tax=Neorhizobium alkalisoli TaxID=528178 RepID=UPI00131A23EE|nr:oligosaccharide flippase family protein [Neorhizobium alkalisoli]